MVRICKIEIRNFRGISKLDWLPKPGINCLVASGDSGKSSILDAIDWCLAPRRSLPVSDADFHNLQVETPIEIVLTLGNLSDSLKGLDGYGMFLRGFNPETGDTEDEPEESLETVLTARLEINADLEPEWSLVSDLAAEQGNERFLKWKHRQTLAPTRIGAYASHHLSWQRGSLLTQISEEKADASAALAESSRKAREAFGDSAQSRLSKTLDIVKGTANNLGINHGETVRALLDAQSVSFSGGTISLHNEKGIPLKKLGSGSSRLLVAGLQKHRGAESAIAIVDEIEHGLEPHRISRLLTTLGAKNKDIPRQVFMTTHSPAVLRELSGDQVHIVRLEGDNHEVMFAGSENAIQAGLRRSAEAFFGLRVIVCEGSTEVGFIRGLDLYRADSGMKTLLAEGAVTVDAGGVSLIYSGTQAFSKLGYPVAVLRDDDVAPSVDDENKFIDSGGKVFKWQKGSAIEDAIFNSVSDDTAVELVRYAISIDGETLVRDHIASTAGKAVDIEDLLKNMDVEGRALMGRAAKSGSWFKSISKMEDATREIIGPNLLSCDQSFIATIKGIFEWCGLSDD